MKRIGLAITLTFLVVLTIAFTTSLAQEQESQISLPEIPDKYLQLLNTEVTTYTCNVYVSTLGADVPTCGSTLTPCLTIQHGVDKVLEGNTVCVAMGYYSDVLARYGCGWEQNSVVDIDKTLNLIGGYNNSFTERNPFLYQTLIDGQNEGHAVYLCAYAETSTYSTVDGFYLQNGYGMWGGGIGAHWRPVEIKNCVFLQNQAETGGGLDATASPLTLTHSLFMWNEAEVGGGIGLFCAAEDNTYIEDVVVASNLAEFGGGISLDGCDNAVLTNINVFSNTANYWAGGVELWFSQNTIMDSTKVSHNSAIEGAGFSVYNSTVKITNSIIDNNSGEGINLGDDTSTSTDYPTPRTSPANKINRESSSGEFPTILRMWHGTIAQNSAGLVLQPNVRTYLTNTIIATHTVGVSTTQGSTITLAATLWSGNKQDWGGTGTIATTRDQQGNPAFLDPNGGNYDLSEHSDARDAGVIPQGTVITTDIAGRPRPVCDRWDLGAFEHQASECPTWRYIYLPIVIR